MFCRKRQHKDASIKRGGRSAKRKADGAGETNGEELRVAKRAKKGVISSTPATGLKTRRAYARAGEKPATHGKPILYLLALNLI
jgi:hypothetical protein